MRVAGIVLFKPNLERLKINLKKILPQVDKLILYYNSQPFQLEEIENEKIIQITYQYKNMGIAYALNRIMEKAGELNADWCLLLDQDSVVPDHILDEFDIISKKMKNDNIAIICPKITDERWKENKVENKVIDIDLCITSGSYNNISIWEKVGKFREDFFIDYVDWEYAARVKSNGYRILELSYIPLNHELGYTEYFKFCGINFQTYNHSAFRKYYITRNTILTYWLYPNVPEFSHPFLRTFKRAFIVIVHENDKINKLNAMRRGVNDALRQKKLIEGDRYAS